MVGLLQFATKVILPGRPFLCRLYSMQQIGSSPSHHTCLNTPVRTDILWWHLFMDRWNGISTLWTFKAVSRLICVFRCIWVMGLWSIWGSPTPPIATKELIPVILAFVMWGKHWTGKIVLYKVDNTAVVKTINATFCKDLHLMDLIRLGFLCSLPQFLVSHSPHSRER